MKELNLANNKLTKLTEEDLMALCDLKGIKPNELVKLNIMNNRFIEFNCFTENTPFVNLEQLIINFNSLRSIFNIRYLTNLIYLDISYLTLKGEKEIISILKHLKNLKTLKGLDTVYNEKACKKIKKLFPNIKYVQ